jgi:dTDP-glucose 4,6-dehydratase
MKLLVTGGCGFIGSNFIHYWLKNHPQDHIINLDSLTYAGNLSSLQDLTSHPGYEFVRGDICHPQTVDSVMPGRDWVVHFAAESHVDRSILDPSVFVTTNVLGTQVLLESAKKHRISRFHHISTDEVFGALPLDSSAKFSETTSYDPRSPYSASKAGSDHLVRSYFHTFGLPVTITNCSNNFGPFQDPEKFIPRIITNLILGQKVFIYGDGLNVRDWLHVEDHCLAIDKVINGGQPGSTYCVGGQKEEYSNLDIAKKILRIFGLNDSQIEFVPDRPGHDRRYAVDWTKIHRDFAWSPLHDLDSWLKDTVEWYQHHRDWWQPLKDRAESIYKS